MKKIKEKYNIIPYTTHTSNYPKASIIERQIRGIKSLFFKHLFAFRVTNYEVLCKLIEVAWNNQRHGGIFFYKPVEVYHDQHIASKVTRLSSVRYKKHQEKSKNIFNQLKESEKLKVGDRVLLALPKKVIRKESSVFYPRFSEEIFIIESIEKTRFPFVYQLKDFPKKDRK